MSLERLLRDEAELLASFLGEEFEMEHQAFYEGLFLTMERSGQDFRTEQEKLEEQRLDALAQEDVEHTRNGYGATEAQPSKVEVAIGQGKTATFYREAGDVLLECEESAFYLDRDEAYRLLSLLEAEFKGSVV